MSKATTLNVRIGGGLQAFVAERIGDSGDYDNASEYVRDLIRRDKRLQEEATFRAKQLALQSAFAEPDSQYTTLSAETVISRNLKQTQ